MIFLLLSLCILILINQCCSQIPSFHYYSHNHSFCEIFLNLPKDSPSLKEDFHTKYDLFLNIPFQWTSQLGQDCKVLEFFEDKTNGYFVDLAANHWKDISNTFSLEYYNQWKGVCIEPNPMYLEGLLANRRCKVFTNPVSKNNGEKIDFRFDGVFGGMVGEEFDNKKLDIPPQDSFVVQLETVNLTTILDYANAPSEIDYLSLDVEGAEFYVFSSVDYSKYQFMVISLERPLHNIHRLLISNGYRYLITIGIFGETIYLHNKHYRFVELMNKYRKDNVVPIWDDHTPEGTIKLIIISFVICIHELIIFSYFRYKAWYSYGTKIIHSSSIMDW